MIHSSFSRRRFATLSGAALGTGFLSRIEADEISLQGKIKKTLKIGMIKEGKTLEEKFLTAKKAGFEGVEISAPGTDVAEAKKAVAATGLPIDGSVCAAHWGVRHTDPDPAVRAQALSNLLLALRDTKEVGGDTVLLVVGHGKDGPEDEIWKRSVANIEKAVSLAEELDMIIAIENVWNHFCYDHEGGSDQTAEKLLKYCDDFQSPHVAMQFDIGNHWKYGNPGDWIRTLGAKRVAKLDIKGFSREKDTFTNIGEGDLDWAGVRKALQEINFSGWCAAEVKGGDLERLKEVAANMDRVLGL
ncbi:MAG: sugar phosphate isomerase/epimerase [Verrucomicrobiales bacterium]|nr:sugar phosphate isomerase/epimerase [Verrucomicrobiales bacterium]